MKNDFIKLKNNLIIFDEPHPSQLSALRMLWKEAFGDSDDFLDIFFSTAYEAKRCRVATINGNVVAALYWFNCQLNNESLAYIYAVATAKRYRGLGICHSLMESTHSHMMSLGYIGAILSPADEALTNFYKNLGYRISSRMHEFSCKCSPIDARNNIVIRKIDKLEYATIRRNLLPPNSIIQENENLDFLEAQAEFYAGDDFLLVANSDGDKLNGIELLGNKEVAPAILSVLGYKQGHFRTPGDDSPFAMYLPLSDKTFKRVENNLYLGFIFD